MNLFANLLKDHFAAKIYLAEIELYNPHMKEVERLYFSSGAGYITNPDETPPNCFYEPRIITPANFERHMFNGSGTYGECRASFGEMVQALVLVMKARLLLLLAKLNIMTAVKEHGSFVLHSKTLIRMRLLLLV